MSPSIGLNLRVTGHCNQGGRKYMEDVFSVAYQQTEDELDLEYAFFGIFDGHGGKEAAMFAKENLMDNITKQPNFWSENDDLVLKAIREGFLKTQQDMWSDQENWRRTCSGFPSTAGTTASIAFIRRGKVFVGHVGDSGIVLGEQDSDFPDIWNPKPLTKDHKPECSVELARIEAAGGKVVNKSGVPRVVWNRPKVGHSGPVRRSTAMDEVPFLAVARALGDLWSYNSKQDVFIVSPEPDLHVYEIDISKHRCLVLGTDGVWNVLSPEAAVNAVKIAEKNNEKHMLDPEAGHSWQNPSKRLVDLAVERWRAWNLRADNSSVVVVMLDPPGPPRAQVLRRQRELAKKGVCNAVKKPCNNTNAPPLPPKPSNKFKGLSIISRFPNSDQPEKAHGRNLVTEEGSKSPETSSRIVLDSTKSEPEKIRVNNATGTVIPTTTKKESEPNLQVAEVTSSNSERPEEVQKEGKRSGNRRSVSRELSNLALDSPSENQRIRRSSGSSIVRPYIKPKRRGRSIDGLGDEDSESADIQGNMVPASKLAEVEKKCQDLKDQLKAMEEKVDLQSRTLSQEVRALRSNIHGGDALTGEKSKNAETPRVLRSRNGNLDTPESGSKRKRRIMDSHVPVKRERTATWAGGKSKRGVARENVNPSVKLARKSTGALNPSSMSKFKRAKLNLKRK